MKRILILFLATISILIIVSSCGSKKSTLSDGYFKYYYFKNEDVYGIIGTEEKGFAETMILPAYFNGKVVKYAGHSVQGILGPTNKSSSVDLSGAKTVYFPFAVEIWPSSEYISFIVNTESAFPSSSYSKEGFAYVTKVAYEHAKQVIKRENEIFGKPDNPKYLSEEIENRILEWKINNNEKSIKIQIANTAYMFNFKDAPNDGYFFINNFEEGDLIEDTPYYPLRAGYTFDGWYKEAECLNKWDFFNDRLFVSQSETEIKLYAKWNKSIS